MIGFSNMLALDELKGALDAIDAPFSTLPDVKDKNGDSIADVREKRLALVRQHIQNAGEVIHLTDHIETQSNMAAQHMLFQKFPEKLRSILERQGLPPKAIDAMLNAKGALPFTESEEEPEEERVFGFRK